MTLLQIFLFVTIPTIAIILLINLYIINTFKANILAISTAATVAAKAAETAALATAAAVKAAEKVAEKVVEAAAIAAKTLEAK